MDRDQSAPTEIHEGVDPASVAAALQRRNQLVARRQRALQSLSWAVSLLVVAALASGAWWLSGEMTNDESGRLSFLLGSDVLPRDPDVAPSARKVTGTIIVTSSTDVVELQVTHDTLTGNGRVVGELPTLGVEEFVISNGQIFELPTGQTGWTVRPLTTTDEVNSFVTVMRPGTIGELVPDEARPYAQIITNRREMSGATVVRRYELSIDQASWQAAMPMSYSRWVSEIGIDPTPRPGGFRMTLWIDEGGIVLRWKAQLDDGVTIEVSVEAFDDTIYVPPVPELAWPIG
jgi:hypothetical protein